jgi:amino acid transporter
VLGGDALDLKILDQTYPTATILSVLIVGAGFLVLAWISIGILTAGGRLISWTTSERDAIRSILQQVSGDRTRKTP